MAISTSSTAIDLPGIGATMVSNMDAALNASPTMLNILLNSNLSSGLNTLITTITSITLLIIGLWNADLELSEKGFYGMSFLLSLFSAITVQKNTRDLLLANTSEKYKD